MRNASQVLTAEDRTAVARAVATAEAHTSAEIVPVVATSSGRYDRAEDLAGLWCGLLALVVVWLLWPQAAPEVGNWGHWPHWIEVACLAASVVAGFVLGVLIASRSAWLCRLLTPRRQLRAEVQARARQVFFDSRIHHAPSQGGLLLYVSLFEHQAAVLGDEQVFRELGQPALDEICGELTQRLSQTTVAAALCETIRQTGERLAAKLPGDHGNSNELPDALILLDRPL
ncbi:MAG: hypothetical protein WD872_14155 [Pirellulaceae bacterium]